MVVATYAMKTVSRDHSNLRFFQKWNLFWRK